MFNTKIVPFFLLLGFSLWYSLCFSQQTRDLDYYLKQTVSNSPLLKDYNNRVIRQQLDSLLILTGKKIQVSATGNLLIAPVYSGYGYDQAITNGGLYSALLCERLTVFQKNYLEAQLQINGTAINSIQNSAKISQRDVEKAVTDQYLAAYRDLYQLLFQKKLTGLLNDELVLLQPLVKSGIYQQADYTALHLQVQSQNIQTLMLLSAYKSDVITLNILSGIFDTSSVLLSPPALQWKETYNPIADAHLLQFYLDSLSVEKNKNLLHYNYVPKVQLFADQGLNAVQLVGIYRKFGYSLGLNLSWNLYDGGQRKLTLQQYALQQSTNADYRTQYTLQHTLQISDLYQQNKALDSVVYQYENELKSEEILLDMRKNQLENGQLSVIDYITTVKDYMGIESSYNEVKLRQQQIVNEHNYLIW